MTFAQLERECEFRGLILERTRRLGYRYVVYANALGVASWCHNLFEVRQEVEALGG
jgi:hypothetical protein